MNASLLNFEGYKRFAFACALTPLAVALAVFVGWVADIEVLKTVLPGYPEMKPIGAGGFLLLAFGLFLSVQDAMIGVSDGRQAL